MTNDPFVESLQTSEAVRLLADAYPSFLSYVNAAYCYQFCNTAYEQHFNVKVEDIVGKTVLEVWGEGAYAVIKPKLDRALAGELVTYESSFDDSHRVASYVPHRGHDGKVRGVLVFAQDTTELNAARAAMIHAERMASLGRVMAGLMHELNTPLGAMRATAQTTARSAKRLGEWLHAEGDEREKGLAKAVRALEAIASSMGTIDVAVTRLDGLLASLRRFAAVDEADVSVCSLADIIDDTLGLLAHRIPEGVRVDRQFAEMPEVTCRAAGLNQIFMTLLTNAVEAVGDAGAIEITGRKAPDGVEVEIADDGPGMTRDQIDVLFMPSFVAGAGRTRAGFGLFVAKNVAKAHDGDIRVQSEIGVGSRFTVELAVSPQSLRADT